jgi:hypothetical protein
MNELCKNSATPLKDQTYESWALQEKRGTRLSHKKHIPQLIP